MKSKSRRILCQVLLSILTFGAVPATESRSFADVPFYYHGSDVGIPFGYGYFHYASWPGNYWLNPTWSGFGYWPYFDYNPYYASFAAIAYSPSTGAIGFSYQNWSRDMAARSAVAYCGSVGCVPVVWVQGGCASIATSNWSGTLGWGYDSSQIGAVARAIDACMLSGGVGCANRAWVCSF